MTSRRITFREIHKLFKFEIYSIIAEYDGILCQYYNSGEDRGVSLREKPLDIFLYQMNYLEELGINTREITSYYCSFNGIVYFQNIYLKSHELNYTRLIKSTIKHIFACKSKDQKIKDLLLLGPESKMNNLCFNFLIKNKNLEMIYYEFMNLPDSTDLLRSLIKDNCVQLLKRLKKLGMNIVKHNYVKRYKVRDHNDACTFIFIFDLIIETNHIDLFDFLWEEYLREIEHKITKECYDQIKYYVVFENINLKMKEQFVKFLGENTYV